VKGERQTVGDLVTGSGAMRLAPVTIALLAIVGCADLGDEPPNGAPPMPTVSFADELEPIFNIDCANCHTNGATNGGLDLNEGASYANLVGIASPSFGTVRVVAGEPDSSFLYQNLTGTQSDGSMMPPPGLLPADKQELVRVWIAEGAQDN